MKRILSGAAGLALIVFTIGFVASAAKADTITQPVGSAGAVTFSTDGGVLAFVRAEAADGWTYTVDPEDGSHLKVTFTDATGAEVEFEAELEGGGVTFGGSDEPGSTTTMPNDETTSTTMGNETTSTTMGNETTSTTIADDSEDESDGPDESEFDDDADDSSDDDSIEDDAPDDSDSGDISDDDSDDAPDDSDDSDDSDDNSGPGNGDEVAAPESATFVVGSAGSVSVMFVGGEVSLTGVSPAEGWTFDVDHAGGSHVEIEFHGADGVEFDFRVDADGEVEIDG